MPIGAAIAAASVASAGIGYLGAKSAAKTQANAALESGQYQLEAARLGANLQLGMFNTIRSDLAPYRATGTAALPAYYRLLGLAPPAAAAPGEGALTIPGLGGGSVPGLTGAPGVTVGGSAPVMPRAGDVNWTQVLSDRPDVAAAYNHIAGQPEGAAFQTPESFAQWWYGNSKPAEDNYQAPTWTQDQIDAAHPAPNAGAYGADIQSALESLPGYQFTKSQGMQAVENALAARGLGGLSGSLGKGLARFVTGLADTTYGEQLNRIGGAVGIGQSAANQTGAYGSAAASGASGALTAGAGAYGAGIVGAANASAAGTVGAANAASGAIQGIGDAYLTSKILGMYGRGTG